MFYYCCHTFYLLLIAQENNYQHDHNHDNMRLRSSQANNLKPHRLYFVCAFHVYQRSLRNDCVR